jgi:acetate kinase
MPDRFLAVNAGSSSLKFALLAERGGDLVHEARGQFDGIVGAGAPRFVARRADGTVLEQREWRADEHLGHAGVLKALLEFLRRFLAADELAGAVHRVVHGGAAFEGPVLVDDAVLARLQTFVPLAPLHQPHNLGPIRLLRDLAPGLPQVACFDTAFHRTLPPVAARFAVPEELHAAGLRRYGFHGLSYEYVAGALRELDPAARAAPSMHSAAARACARAAASRDDVVQRARRPCMATRCGAPIPAVLWLTRHAA